MSITNIYWDQLSALKILVFAQKSYWSSSSWNTVHSTHYGK